MRSIEEVNHELNCFQPFFDDVWNGFKNFEVRKHDRFFQVSDTLLLREYPYTNRAVHARIIYILDGGQHGIDAEYCVLGLNILCNVIHCAMCYTWVYSVTYELHCSYCYKDVSP